MMTAIHLSALVASLWIIHHGFFRRYPNERLRLQKRGIGYIGMFYFLSTHYVMELGERHRPMELVLMAAGLWCFYLAFRTFGRAGDLVSEPGS